MGNNFEGLWQATLPQALMSTAYPRPCSTAEHVAEVFTS